MELWEFQKEKTKRKGEKVYYIYIYIAIMAEDFPNLGEEINFQIHEV